jgi:XRE family transcriptional regulator, master regulator for biofilm formation
MIGKNIYNIRRSKGLTLTELAERADISKSYLSNIERDINKNPSIKILEKISIVLEVDLNLLLVGTHLENGIIDPVIIDFANELKEMGIEKEHLQDYKSLIEYIKWKSDYKKSN